MIPAPPIWLQAAAEARRPGWRFRGVGWLPGDGFAVRVPTGAGVESVELPEIPPWAAEVGACFSGLELTSILIGLDESPVPAKIPQAPADLARQFAAIAEETFEAIAQRRTRPDRLRGATVLIKIATHRPSTLELRPRATGEPAIIRSARLPAADAFKAASPDWLVGVAGIEFHFRLPDSAHGWAALQRRRIEARGAAAAERRPEESLPAHATIDRAIRETAKRHYGFGGNCAAFAWALQSILGRGEYAVVEGDHYEYADHVGLAVDGRIYDGEGGHSPKEFRGKWGRFRLHPLVEHPAVETSRWIFGVVDGTGGGMTPPVDEEALVADLRLALQAETRPQTAEAPGTGRPGSRRRRKDRRTDAKRA